jgi:hypothetical protein
VVQNLALARNCFTGSTTWLTPVIVPVAVDLSGRVAVAPALNATGKSRSAIAIGNVRNCSNCADLPGKAREDSDEYRQSGTPIFQGHSIAIAADGFPTGPRHSFHKTQQAGRVRRRRHNTVSISEP